LEIHGITGSYSILSASVAVSASTYYGDGSNLTNITASEIEAAGDTNDVQYNLNDDLTGSNNFTFDNSTLALTGDFEVEGTISSSARLTTVAITQPSDLQHNYWSGNMYLNRNTILSNSAGPTIIYLGDGSGSGNNAVRFGGDIIPYSDMSFDSDAYWLGLSNRRWTEAHIITGSFSIVSASVAVSASTYYGDGSNLTNITASEIEAAGDTNDVQYNLNDDLTGSNNFTFDGTTLNVLTTASMGKIFADNSIAADYQKPVFSSGDYYTYFGSYGAPTLNTPWVNNILFLANQRFTLTETGSSVVPTLFNNIYNESAVEIPSGTTMRVFDLDLTASEVLSDYGVIYPKGFFVAHFLGAAGDCHLLIN